MKPILLPILILSTPACAGICPVYGDDTDCGTVITVTDLGAVVSHTGQGPYDANLPNPGVIGDDTLVGVHNISRVPVHSFAVSSGGPIFAFDGDGLGPATAIDPSGYGGPGVSFTHATDTSGVVSFSPSIPVGGTAYFGLETALTNATSLGDIVNNALKFTIDGPNITVTFKPNLGYDLAEAAAILGIQNFDWVQTVTDLPDPSPFYTKSGTHLTSASTPFNDPVLGGYRYMRFDDLNLNAYPYYYDPRNRSLADQETASNPTVSTSPDTLKFLDDPNDPCLAGGSAQYCGQGSFAPPGSFLSFHTELVGVQHDGRPMDLGVGWSWTDDFNGVTGGVTLVGPKLSGGPIISDTGNYITIESIREITNAEVFGQINVGDINASGAPFAVIPEPATWTMMVIGFLSLGLIRRMRLGMIVAALTFGLAGSASAQSYDQKMRRIYHLSDEWFACNEQSDCMLIGVVCATSFAVNRQFAEEAEKIVRRHGAGSCLSVSGPPVAAVCDGGECATYSRYVGQ